MSDSILAAAPRRTARTWSVILLAVAVISNLAIVAVQTLGDAHVLSLIPLAYLNAGLAFLTGCARFLAQTIEITSEEKKELLIATASAPMAHAEKDVIVTLNGVPVLK